MHLQDLSDSHSHLSAGSCGGQVCTQDDEGTRSRADVDLSPVIWLSGVFRRGVSGLDQAADRKYE